MPDMQTALGKALEEGKRRFLSATLSEWDAHEQEIRQPKPPQENAMQPQVRNMRHDAFALVKSNPNKYAPKDATAQLVRMGHKESSAHVALVQMKKAGMFASDANGKLYTITETYKSFTNPYNPKYKKPKKAKPAAKSAGIAALAGPVAAPAAVPAYKVEPMPTVLTSEYVMARIGVSEAHKLYVELGKMFGGK